MVGRFILIPLGLCKKGSDRPIKKDNRAEMSAIITQGALARGVVYT